MIRRAFLVSSRPESLDVELSHLKNIFCDKNDYPRKLVDEIVKNEKKKFQQNKIQPTIKESSTEDEEKPVVVSLNLPYTLEIKEKNWCLK